MYAGKCHSNLFLGDYMLILNFKYISAVYIIEAFQALLALLPESLLDTCL